MPDTKRNLVDIQRVHSTGNSLMLVNLIPGNNAIAVEINGGDINKVKGDDDRGYAAKFIQLIQQHNKQ